MKPILIPLPKTDFDPTECAVPWETLKQAGIEVKFATSDGQPATCDQRMLLGTGLGLLAPSLMADENARAAYVSLEQSDEFKRPLKWSELRAADYAGVILPGGHAPGMKEYLESSLLQELIAEFFKADKPVGAICHGVVLAARSKMNGQSVLFGRKTTALLASQELLAWGLTFLWLGRYYRTYSQTVEAEVKSCLAAKRDFLCGPLSFTRDKADDLKAGFTVCDGRYLSARWPGDAHKFGADFVKLLQSS